MENKDIFPTPPQGKTSKKKNSDVISMEMQNSASSDKKSEGKEKTLSSSIDKNEMTPKVNHNPKVSQSE